VRLLFKGSQTAGVERLNKRGAKIYRDADSGCVCEGTKPSKQMRRGQYSLSAKSCCCESRPLLTWFESKGLESSNTISQVENYILNFLEIIKL